MKVLIEVDVWNEILFQIKMIWDGNLGLKFNF